MVFAVLEAVDGERSLVCIRREAVRTNCPTAALKPDRKALNGCAGLLVGSRGREGCGG